MSVADSFPHLNNSISEAASPAQGAQRKGDWQACRAVIHEIRQAWAEEKESELEVENLSGFVILDYSLSVFPPPSLFYFFLFC